MFWIARIFKILCKMSSVYVYMLSTAETLSKPAVVGEALSNTSGIFGAFGQTGGSAQGTLGGVANQDDHEHGDDPVFEDDEERGAGDDLVPEGRHDPVQPRPPHIPEGQVQHRGVGHRVLLTNDYGWRVRYKNQRRFPFNFTKVHRIAHVRRLGSNHQFSVGHVIQSGMPLDGPDLVLDGREVGEAGV